MKIRSLLSGVALLALAGCNTFTLMQENGFLDEEGNFISVRYGQLKEARKTEFVSPVNGKKFDMSSKLAVEVVLPSGETFTGYQCMNLLRSGTLYSSSNGKWLFHANGTSCSVYLIAQNGRDYLLVFNGTLSEGSRRGK